MYDSSSTRVGLPHDRKVFLPAMGRKGEKYLSAGEKWHKMGRYGDELPDLFILRCSTITICKPEYIHSSV